jgi:hypothetical protein
MSKALTICQPYAHLIARGDKRVENREWPTSYRGTLYIHAGKSREWLDLSDDETRDESYDIPLSSMAFGAVVAVATLRDCLHIDRINRGDFDRQYPWLKDHEHTNGTWCWIIDAVAAIGPWPWRGAQGLWDIDEDALCSLANKELGIQEPTPPQRSTEP